VSEFKITHRIAWVAETDGDLCVFDENRCGSAPRTADNPPVTAMSTDPLRPPAADGQASDLRARFRAASGSDWSPSVAPFLGGGRRVDPIGLATVLSYGYAVSTRTVLESVEASAIDPARFADTAVPSDSDIVDLAIDAARRHLAIAPGLQPPIALLSGGRDSRLIVLAMRALAVKPRMILTLDQRGPESDAAVAEQLASALGLAATRVRAEPFSGERELERHAQQSFQSLEHEWFLPIAARVRGIGGGVTDGIGAGVLSTGSLLDPQAIALWRGRRYDALSEWTANHGSRVSHEFLAAARAEGLPLADPDAVLHEFAGVLRSLDGTPNPLGMYSLLHWTRRGIGASAYGLLPHDRVITPLYDERLCRALAAIPMERAMAQDWREVVISRLDQTGVPYSVKERGVLPRWLQHPLRTARSRLAWGSFVRRLSPPLARLARIADRSPWPRNTFDRAAVGLLASLDRSTGFLSGGPRGA